MSATKYVNMENNDHYKTESFIEIQNSKSLEIKCEVLKKNKHPHFQNAIIFSSINSTVIKQDITEYNVTTEILEKAWLLVSNHIQIKFSFCCVCVF